MEDKFSGGGGRLLRYLMGEKLDLYNAVISVIYNLSYVWVV